MADTISRSDTVGSLLAHIATALQDALRILMFADKRSWGRGEFEQVRVLEETLAEAKRDFQAMAPLVNGQFYYENDRRTESIRELRALRAQFDRHAQTFKDWLRTGGPVSPLWARETVDLGRQLHRAQCRAARRIYNAEHEDGGSGARCLGAFLVYRRLREQEERRTRTRSRPPLERVPTWKRQQMQMQKREEQRYAGREQLSRASSQDDGDIELSGLPPLDPEMDAKKATSTIVAEETAGSSSSSSPSPYGTKPRLSLEDLVPDCNAVGTFERFGDQDVVFICDFCDGHIVWEDVHRLPHTRTNALSYSADPLSPSESEPRLPFTTQDTQRPPVAAPPSPRGPDDYPRWQATAMALSNRDKERTIVFPPLAIANHLPPTGGDWEARLWCPYCDEYMYYDSAEGDNTKYAQGEFGFLSLNAFQEHLEWYHTALPIPALPVSSNSCAVM
ncbi:hypothetical protein CMQ_1370 [Grosmannia clavigera kw1407]|uniref:Uncharacterized protein n=1 Tax=Grosmannia clavigera (strain kw1407 / UAMH 11150) TaxID=655863 RepID=F0XFT3_GROCL|nr:uncharacterized protein CMQ_1370 [Grosmannia clavigera kw1407]EFX04442.1 hypothetical protein CMQ_1370 [Grosmannia clavigera kw1407]